MRSTKRWTRNGAVAAIYVVIALALPATALANYRLATALYVLAALDPGLIPGLVLGNALAGIPEGPVDMIAGGAVALLTTIACARLGRWAPAAVLILPTVLVPIWLGWLYQAPYLVVLVSVAQGQLFAAALGGWLLVNPATRWIVRDGQQH